MSLQMIAFCYICMMLACPLTICLLFALKKGSAKEVKSQDQNQYEYGCALVKAASLVSDTFEKYEENGMLGYQYPEDYEPCDSYWCSLYEDMCNRENAEAAGCTVEELCFCGYQAKDPDLGDGSRCSYCYNRHTEYLATREAIRSLEGVDPQIDWEEYEEDEDEEDPNFCYECGKPSPLGINCGCENDEDLNQVTRECLEKETYYEDLRQQEEALWHQEVEAALMATKAFIPKFKNRKKNFEKKDLRSSYGVSRRIGRRTKASWLR